MPTESTAAPANVREVAIPSFRASGGLIIESDDADVDAVPSGTRVGDLAKLRESYKTLREEAIRLNANADARNELVRAFAAAKG